MNAHVPTPREMHRPDFPAVVHTYTDALRVLGASAAPMAPNELADATQRVLSNIKRDLPKLREAGVLTVAAGGQVAITDKGRRWVAGVDVAEGAAPPPAGEAAEPRPGDVVMLYHAQIQPDVLNPRGDFDSDEAEEDLDALRQDILQNGLLQNLVVREAGPLADWNINTPEGVKPLYRLVSGERRWRAIEAAIGDDDWPRDRKIACMVIEADDLKHRLVALAENLQRRNLSPIEEAEAYRGLTECGLATQDIADRVSVTQRQVQMRLQLLELSQNDQWRMTLPKDDPAHLSVSGARLILRGKEEAAQANPVREELAVPAAPEEPAPLSPTAQIYLAEIYHATLKRPAKAQPLGPTTRLESWINPEREAAIAELIGQGMVLLSRAYPYEVSVIPPGVAWLKRQPGNFMDADTALRVVRMNAGLTAEDEDRLQADGLYNLVQPNVTPPPAPEALSDGEALVLLELLDHTKVWKPGEGEPKADSYYGAPIRPDYDKLTVTPLPSVDMLKERRLLDGPYEYSNHNDGVCRVKLSTKGAEALAAAWPGSGKPKDRESALGTLRKRLARAPSEGETYATPWLNGPFKATKKWRDAKSAAARAEMEREQKEAAAQDRYERLKVQVDAFEAEAAAMPPDARSARLAELLEAANAPLPWRLQRGQHSWQGLTLYAANGVEVSDDAPICNRLRFIAMHIAGGLDPVAWTPSLPAAPDAEAEPEGSGALGREAFEAVIAEALAERGLSSDSAAAKATELLDAWLEGDGIEFGDDNYDWGASDAAEFADNWDEDQEEGGK